MPTPYGMGCAFVRAGTWSSLSAEAIPTLLFFKLNGCHTQQDTLLKLLFNLNFKYSEEDFNWHYAYVYTIKLLHN